MSDRLARWAAAAVSLAMSCGLAQGGETDATEVGLGYEVVSGWPQLPEGEILGQATGVDIDSQGRIWVFHRAGREWSEPFPADPIARTTLWVFDPVSGRRLMEWGAGRFIMPHGITIDRDDNVWLTDVGLHQVFKFTPDGRLLLALGEAGVAGSDDRHFDKPTDVAVADDGSFFVGDGYGNARVLHFAGDGKLLRQWGTHGSEAGQFDTPHGIALDAGGRVLVADRGNSRVQVFDQAGRFLTLWQSADLGRPYAIEPAPAGRVFVADGGDQPQSPPDRSGVAVTDVDGHVLTRFGRFGNQDGQFRLAHDLAVAPDGAVYVVDAWGQRVQKFAHHSTDERTAVLAVIDRFMTAISSNDLAALADVQTPDGMTYRAYIAPGGAAEVVGRPNSYWVQPERNDGRQRLERYWSPVVHVRGSIAVVWTPYEFWLDGQRSHCGIDSFDLVKVDGRWWVANAMWTVEPAGCASLSPPEASQMRPRP